MTNSALFTICSAMRQRVWFWPSGRRERLAQTLRDVQLRGTKSSNHGNQRPKLVVQFWPAQLRLSWKSPEPPPPGPVICDSKSSLIARRIHRLPDRPEHGGVEIAIRDRGSTFSSHLRPDYINYPPRAFASLRITLARNRRHPIPSAISADECPRYMSCRCHERWQPSTNCPIS